MANRLYGSWFIVATVLIASALGAFAQIYNPGGSGTINNATGAGNAYYGAVGTTVSADTNIVDDGAGNYIFSGTNPTFTTSTTNKGLTFTPNGTGTYIFGGGLDFSGASGAATTIRTTTTNANLLLSPNGTGAVQVPAGAVTQAGIVFAGDTTGGIMRQNANGPCVNNGTKCILWFDSGANKLHVPANGIYSWSNTATDATTTADTSLNRKGPGVVGVGLGGSEITGLILSGMKTFVTADFTTAANTNLQTITGLSWTLPVSTAVNLSFHCALLYSQATATAAVAFGVQGATTAPTQINASGIEWSAASGAWTATGVLTGLNTTTATNVVSGTPSAITTVWRAELDGTIEAPSNASPTVFNVMVSTATSGDAVTVKRGSYCTLY